MSSFGAMDGRGWLPTGSHTRCPVCLNLDVRVRIEDLGTDHASWVFLCFHCGAEGPATMKTPEEKGRWVDEYGSPAKRN